MSAERFKLSVIKPNETVSAEQDTAPEVLLEGLEEVLSDAAENVARYRRMRNNEAKPDHNQAADGLTPYALSISQVLNKVLLRPDDSTWSAEISQRASDIGDQAT
ncbi:MAG TPA: hypothetical protein VNG32_04240 [Candidatus Dormibacteraeota bacterium]|nr:hypothetical protein [Candidatus Dormibacteraeota bacterium]